jgi:nicotinate-nucleotide--dimethylbenzimidazole phosphoribosyltransferase
LARKILLADDSVTAQNMGRKILADAGYEVITVNNGSAALKRVADSKPDLIVLDVYMPGYSGLEVCQRLKEVSETARIPILLTVGKLEPFKPEEARRARADGFIVKPFEASELLSALTKLEDKIVPRSETSKPGRFARAIAAVEEGRYDKTVAIEEDSGWKERISFPSKKKSKVEEPEEVEDPAIHSPVGKDSRKQVEHPPMREAAPEDTRVDLAALAFQGLPKDVTPEEIAALAAAAAQIQGTPSGKSGGEGRVVEIRPAESRAAEDRVREIQATTPEAIAPEPQPPVAARPEASVEEKPEAKAEKPAAETAEETAAALSSVEALAEPKAEEQEKPEGPAEKPGEVETKDASVASAARSAEEKPELAALEPPADTAGKSALGDVSDSSVAADEPVTMAAAAGVESGGTASRWMAVPVALLPEEAAISLEQEMQKTYAALAAADGGGTAPQEAATQPTVVAAIEAPEAEPPAPVGFPPELAEPMSSLATETTPAIQVKEFETVAAPRSEAEPPVPTESEAAAPQVAEPLAEAPQSAETKADEEPVVEDEKPVVESVAAEPEAAALQIAPEPALQEQARQEEPQPAVEAAIPQVSAEKTEAAAPVPVSEVSAAPTPASAVSARASETSAQRAAGGVDDMAKKEKEMAANTAAAWASWRRVRESGEPKAQPSPEPAAKEAAEAPARRDRDEAAMAAAAGAEKVPEEVPADSESAEIASIVDTVLADLRPKIVEEISRKMGKKKK